ncbi:hypothetical protein LAZ67_23000141 [Cordylochernes scorpioides]|uniref:Transposase n=1 Tax=Cordylochernes scorpioides TaxID=51811 RepID=A0ABY6LTY6_9ARAC|nr:hypothetical protein LAZ67_23000141 [Cordylochernes scorpioides]
MVIGLKGAGWSIRQIPADTHLGASTVHRLWRRWLEQGNVAIYRNVGASRVTSARVDRRILRQAVAAPQATCTAILQHVQDTLDHSISTRTISRRLVANGLHSCRPLRRLPLTPPNRRQRLEWCRARSTWMTEWHRVVFSDESRFCLSSDSRRVGVWRRRGERSNPAAIVERPTMRQRGIMDVESYDSRSPLLRIQGTMTAQRYVDDVLRPVTLPYLQGVPNALYQQDNARPHTARISQQALQDVQMLPWPPSSPDLSPIEHVWDIIGRRLHALPQPRSEDELWQMVEREWRAIPQDAIRTLIDSLPRRVAACIAVRGKALAATGEVWKIMEKSRLNSFGSSMKLLDSIILSTLLYSAPIWANEKYKILDQIQNNYLRRLLNLPSNTPGYILRMETGRFSLGVTATKLILKFWLRILKMEKSRLPAICLAQLWETSTLTNAFIGFTENLMNILNSTGFMWLKNCSDPNILQKAIPQIIRITIEQSIQTDQSRITNSKLHTHYKYLHKTFAAENYLLKPVKVDRITEDSSMQRMTEAGDEYVADALTNMQPHCEDLVSRLTDAIRGLAVSRAEEVIFAPIDISCATNIFLHRLEQADKIHREILALPRQPASTMSHGNHRKKDHQASSHSTPQDPFKTSIW